MRRVPAGALLLTTNTGFGDTLRVPSFRTEFLISMLVIIISQAVRPSAL